MGASTRRTPKPLRLLAPPLSCSGGALLAVLVLLELPAAWGETRAGVGSAQGGNTVGAQRTRAALGCWCRFQWVKRARDDEGMGLWDPLCVPEPWLTLGKG